MGGGEVELMGKKWTALSADNSVIPPHEFVVVKKVDGVKLIVKRKSSQ
jgi:membrane protein implicated in regulation of membrane protease activity